MSTIVLGLTGKNASGKGTVAEVLKEHGFVYHSLSDSLRDELNLLGKKETRENLIEIGNKLRNTGGPGVLADKLTSKLTLDCNHIVDSIRNPFEVESLRESSRVGKFFLISVDVISIGSISNRKMLVVPCSKSVFAILFIFFISESKGLDVCIFKFGL